MRYKRFIVPRGGKISALEKADISQEARFRLSWMNYYRKTGNARLTCRHFGISPDTFYHWKKRYKRDCLKTLEDDRKTLIACFFIFLEKSKRLKHGCLASISGGFFYLNEFRAILPGSPSRSPFGHLEGVTELLLPGEVSQKK